jgi:autoinducer 2 (AI-2) kinase
MLSDWITHRLCGARVAEPSNAAESMLFDVGRRTWSEEVLSAFDVPASILPALHPSGAAVGTVHARAAADTGIPEGTPVFTGGADTQCALLGSGAVAAGDTAAILGTTCPVQMATDRPVLDPAANLWTSCHVVPERWVLESNAGETGGAYRWLLRLLLGASDAAAHEAAEAAAAAATRPALCYLGPIVFDLRKMNPFRPGGVLFRFPIIHVDRPERGDVLRGFLESIAFAVRANCEQIAAVAGHPPRTLKVSGGMTASPTLVRLLADTLALPVEVATVPESASLGCAVLLAAGVGLHASLDEAVAAMTASRRVEPLPGAAESGDRYRKWRELYTALEQCSV